MTTGKLDEVPVPDVRRFESELRQELTTRHGQLMDGLNADGQLTDERLAALERAVDDFRSRFRTSADTAEREEHVTLEDLDVLSDGARNGQGRGGATAAGAGTGAGAGSAGRATGDGTPPTAAGARTPRPARRPTPTPNRRCSPRHDQGGGPCPVPVNCASCDAASAASVDAEDHAVVRADRRQPDRPGTARRRGGAPYASLVTRVIRDLSTEVEATSHPLLAPREQTRAVGVLVIASDRGLAAPTTPTSCAVPSASCARRPTAGARSCCSPSGARPRATSATEGYEPARAWAGISDQPTYQAAREVGEALTEAYVAEDVDRVWMVYTDFKSALSQVSATAKVLPVDPVQFEGGTAYPPTFEFEPDPASILSQLIPRYVEQRVYAGLLESAASEHASRQRAMKAATDNAGDIIEDLTREANQARQAAITTEISEIVGGAEALSKR